MHRAKLDNGIPVLYGTDPAGHVVIQYPDGSQVRTTWTQVSLIESLIDHLQQAYACLLRRASTDPATPVDTLMRIDDLLFSLHQLHHSTSSGPPTKPNRPFAMARGRRRIAHDTSRIRAGLAFGSVSATMGAMRFLGVDFGTKRIGLAVAESGAGIASPLKIIESRPQAFENARSILKVADEYAADAIVIGLPLNMDGTEGPQAKLSRALAEALRSLSGLAVHLHDERLTSHAADHKLLDRDLTRKQKKARHDAVAAQILLESFLVAREPQG